MKGYMRFFCPECGKLLDRRNVVEKPYEGGYRCRLCGHTAMSVKKLAQDIIKDYVDYCIKHGEDTEKYEIF